MLAYANTMKTIFKNKKQKQKTSLGFDSLNQNQNKKQTNKQTKQKIPCILTLPHFKSNC